MNIVVELVARQDMLKSVPLSRLLDGWASRALESGEDFKLLDDIIRFDVPPWLYFAVDWRLPNCD